MSRRTRLRRQRHRERAARSFYKPGTASDYIWHLAELLKRYPRKPVVLWCRVSGMQQQQAGNLDDLINEAMLDLAKLGCRVIAIFDGVESSHSEAERPLLDAALAGAAEHDAILVAPDRTRLLRHAGFDGSNATERPTEAEYSELLRRARGVLVATILHPDKRARSRQTRRGIIAKDAAVGRRPKPEQEQLRNAVVELMRRLPR